MRHSLLFIFCLLSFASYAQQWDWAIQENVRKFAVDSTGNVFTQNDSTIKRFNSKGVFKWQKQFSGDLLISGMVADNSGNLYIAGGFTDFFIGAYHFTSLGNRDIFFCKIDSLGTLLWKKIVGGTNDDNVTDLYLTKKQKILICGNVGAGAVFGSIIFSETEFFTARYDVNGSMEMLFNHSGGDAWEVSGDTNGNTYLLGGINNGINNNDTLDFGNGVILYGYGGGGDPGNYFIAKFNSTGNILWANDLGCSYYEPFKNLAIDNNGNFYLAKWQRYNGFDLSKFDGLGNFIWNHNTNGIYGDCYALCIDNNDAIWLAGDIWNSPFYGQSFIWEFDSSSNLTETTPATVSASGNNIANDNSNNIYISGVFNDTAVFGTTILLASAGNYFLAKMGRNSNAINYVNNISENLDAISIFPNPSTGKFTVQTNMPWQNTEICIFDLSGRCVYHQQVTRPEDYQIDLSKHSKGVYFIEVANAEKRMSKKVVIQ